ncbi:TraB/VirB10 family protein, partial [Neisseria gonorrhoeae]
GVRGNLVTKQGQLLANALMSGVISGMGKGVSEAFKVTNNTAFGSTTSIRGSDQYRAGIASGIGGAADRLAEYYIKLADKVFPVVEVNAGRQVDVVLTQGIEIDTGETK